MPVSTAGNEYVVQAVAAFRSQLQGLLRAAPDGPPPIRR